MKYVIILILLGSISGCVNGQIYNFATKMDYMMQACTDLGYVKGSPEHNKCAEEKYDRAITRSSNVIQYNQ